MTSTSQSQTNYWLRPLIDKNTYNIKENDLNLHWLDIDMISSTPLTRNPNSNRKSVPGAHSGTVPVIRIYGVNELGNSVCVFIHGYTPYGYFALPQNYEIKNPKRYLDDIRHQLNSALLQTKNITKENSNEEELILAVQYETDKSSIMGYSSSHTKFLKVYVSMPTLIPTIKRIMEEGISLSGFTMENNNDMEDICEINIQFQPFECNVPFVLRFMIDHQITGAGWLSLPKNTYTLRTHECLKTTHCQIEADICYDEVIPHELNEKWSKIAPLRVLSIDIECQGRKGYFPEAEKDPVIQIANILQVYGETKPIVKNIFTLKSCLPIVGANIISSNHEDDMLKKFQIFLQSCDADIITGYNVQNFDIPYLIDRAKTLSKDTISRKKLSEFMKWGRVKGDIIKMKGTTFQSAAYGKRNNVETNIGGRVVFDMLPYMQRNHKLSSYSLNNVSCEFLGQQKEDVHHSIISDLQNGTDEDRHRLAVYCLKDALLPLLLIDKLSVLVNYIEMARVTGVPVSFLISRGQQIKVFSMLLRKCLTEKLLVPTLSKTGIISNNDVGYEGATVLDPIKNYYQVPIATLDFASLYPSIMQAYNLCYSTLMNSQDLQVVDKNDYDKSENGHIFVKSSVKKGILPIILEELLHARKRAKNDMKNATSSFEKTVQNGRQLALKISANSVYGFTGAGVGQLPCLPIASSVTSYGRQLLEKTKRFIETHFTTNNGYDHDAEVVYGDTDSVMIKFGMRSIANTFPLAIEAAEKCSQIFPRPILLEFEKVYFPYLLMNKKRYAGLMWTNTYKFDSMDTKGLETVRRDNCALVREVIQTSLDMILIHQNVPKAISYVKSQIADLLQNKMDISRLVITKSLNKGAEYMLGLGGKKEDYKVKQAHVELAVRMKKRDPGSAPQMGDRVPYVIVTGAKGATNFEKAENPVYVLENNLPIDYKWYLSNQLAKPLIRIFEPIIDNVEGYLLQGDHTRKIYIPTPTAKKGSLMMFAKRKASCMNCRTSMEPHMGHLCKYCIPKESAIYLEKLGVYREAEMRYFKLWSEAQRIHETLYSNIMCTGDRCGCQFYRRKKVQTDIRVAKETMDKFGY